MALTICLALSGMSLPANAAGLGKAVVFSGLGQPLRAEIEVMATREEFSGMSARLASQEAFQQVGLDYAASLQKLHFIIEQRDAEHVIIRLLSTTPINDPFIDLLLELDWPSGHLVREYTFLLDPSEALVNSATQSGLLVLNLPEVPARSLEAPMDAVNEAVGGTVLSESGSPLEATAKETEQRTEAVTLREVKRGDTLSKIALSVKPEGVSLEQMLVILFRANQEAFDGANMNRLRAGKVLVIPRQTSPETIPVAAAKKIVVAQSADWNAYRSKLAAMAAQLPVKAAGGKQKDASRLVAKLDGKALASVATRDQLKVSSTDVESMPPGAMAKKIEEDLVAKEKALKEANERLALLEKNVANLEKLLNPQSLRLEEKLPQATEKATPVRVKKALDMPKAKKKADPPQFDPRPGLASR